MHIVIQDRRPGKERPRWNVMDSTTGITSKLRDYCRRNGHRYFTVLQALKRQIATGAELDLQLVVHQIAARKARSGGYYSRPSSTQLAEREQTRTIKKRGPKNVAYTPDYSKRPDFRPLEPSFAVVRREAVGRDGTVIEQWRLHVLAAPGYVPLKLWCDTVGVPYSVIMARIKRLGRSIDLVLAPPSLSTAIIPVEEP